MGEYCLRGFTLLIIISADERGNFGRSEPITSKTAEMYSNLLITNYCFLICSETRAIKMLLLEQSKYYVYCIKQNITLSNKKDCFKIQVASERCVTQLN